MKLTASPNLNQLADVEITATITMPLSQWESIATALNKGKDGYLGPAQGLLNNLDKIIELYKGKLQIHTQDA